jgi:hypothetical protein
MNFGNRNGQLSPSQQDCANLARVISSISLIWRIDLVSALVEAATDD